MTRFSRIICLAFIASLAACNDQTAPLPDDSPAFARGGRQAATDIATVDDAGSATADPVSTTCGSGGVDTGVPPCTLRHRADAPPLDGYSYTFRVIQGRKTSHSVFYQDGMWFMSLLIPREGTFVDQYGTPYADGDTVLVTMEIDPEFFHVEFGPHGSTFQGRFPAVIQFSLDYADVDADDLSALSIHYRPQAGDLWTSLPTSWKQKSWWVEAPIDHFSGYAVAW